MIEALLDDLVTIIRGMIIRSAREAARWPMPHRSDARAFLVWMPADWFEPYDNQRLN